MQSTHFYFILFYFFLWTADLTSGSLYKQVHDSKTQPPHPLAGIWVFHFR